ncbi:hypothetical protein OHV05_11745 [Kitasatospora sp. NBC_00070]|uniref:WXG100 family type VII secretion target n=1 Tax=Kitasatospora sp. NBC_00070 TaxID=2975962 RepID=UPI0032476587
MSGQTDFNSYSHGDLRRMVGSMDSGGVMSAADPWRRATDTLKQIRTSLTTASSDATASWEGATSEAFHSKMITLATGINNVAAYANDAAVALELMSAAIDEAKRTMPEEPGFWSKAADAIGDTAAAATGSDDEDTKTAVTDEKKAQAVAVMNLLASRYRTTTEYLKPPPNRISDPSEVIAPDSAGPAVLSALIMGGGVGLAGSTGAGSASTKSRASASLGGASPQAPKKIQPSGPTDPGIKGGTANPPPKPQSPAPFGPGTGIDGGVVSTKPGTTVGTAPGAHGSGPGAGAGAGNGSVSGGLVGGGSAGAGGSKAGIAGGTAGSRGPGGANFRVGEAGVGGRTGSAFGASGMPGAGGAAAGSGGSGVGGGAGSSSARRAGGTAGAIGSGSAGRGAFTEGGSGLGRARGQGGQGAMGQGGGMPGASQPGKKDKKDKRRPDYLVEDEETWATGAPTNPNVVE